MSRNRPTDSNGRTQPVSALKIDTPILVVSMLTLFFAAMFATLLLLRPESSDPTELMPAAARSTQSAPRVNAPPVSAPPVNAAPVNAPPVSAAPPEPILRAELKSEPEPNPTLQTRLEQLGIKCAEGASCYPE